MTEQEIYAEKFRELIRAKQEEMDKALEEIDEWLTTDTKFVRNCRKIAVAFNLRKSNVRSLDGRNYE